MILEDIPENDLNYKEFSGYIHTCFFDNVKNSIKIKYNLPYRATQFVVKRG